MLTVYPYRSACPKSIWRNLINAARNEIVFAGYTNYFLWLEHPNLAKVLTRKAQQGCKVRFLVGDPESDVTRRREDVENVPLTVSTRIRITLSEIEQLRDVPGAEARYGDEHIAMSVFRFDAEMLVTPHLAKLVGHDSPMCTCAGIRTTVCSTGSRTTLLSRGATDATCGNSPRPQPRRSVTDRAAIVSDGRGPPRIARDHVPSREQEWALASLATDVPVRQEGEPQGAEVSGEQGEAHLAQHFRPSDSERVLTYTAGMSADRVGAVTFSDLSRNPRAVAERAARLGRVRVTHRDAPDFYLTVAEREEDRERTMATASRLLLALIKHDPTAHALVIAMPDVFPWVRHLSSAELRAFTLELVRALSDAAELDVDATIHEVIAGWQATARIKADPLRYSEARKPTSGDFGPVQGSA
ncbi:hypothetical protein ACIBKY_07460 [Nonomuraea sp. NPDC050394]|uniref:hypothetical protein n=1 Tax=Nonomuraea sp. NPDC050394 TaxID=3364363 RepID=UPI00378AB0DC